ncbi:uncharacterized protein LOC128314993 [Acinonyx jubatus]|uniref:Uncharacterized protein LOC128314993 n=1 Tax=Acinonyx jubatus TaxID=32536 RepID=A0ABM3PX75_ACIJB|nr:uncharacterized protein LOC128314993 [Acinonyx jubatus]
MFEYYMGAYFSLDPWILSLILTLSYMNPLLRSSWAVGRESGVSVPGGCQFCNFCGPVEQGIHRQARPKSSRRLRGAPELAGSPRRRTARGGVGRGGLGLRAARRAPRPHSGAAPPSESRAGKQRHGVQAAAAPERGGAAARPWAARGSASRAEERALPSPARSPTNQGFIELHQTSHLGTLPLPFPLHVGFGSAQPHLVRFGHCHDLPDPSCVIPTADSWQFWFQLSMGSTSVGGLVIDETELRITARTTMGTRVTLWKRAQGMGSIRTQQAAAGGLIAGD